MSQKYWKIKGMELAFDNLDSVYMKRYEEAYDLMEQDARALPKDGKKSDYIIAYCDVFHKLFDRIFGEGTSAKLFAGEPTSIDRYHEIYEEFLSFVAVCNAESIQKQAELFSKYKPANRKQKRAAKKK